MKRSIQASTNSFTVTSEMRKKVAKDLANEKTDAPKFTRQNVRINSSGNAAYTLDSLPTDMVHLGSENFVLVSGFIGQTRIHVRRHVCDEDGYYHPTKDGISLSPKVWLSFCGEVNEILNCKLPEKVFVIDRDLCVCKQTKDDVQLFIFQRLFQKKNLSMQFVPECVVLRGPELGKLADKKNFITECVKSNLITYTLSFNLDKEIKHSKLNLKTSDYSEGFLQLIESLGQCLCVFITLKITELINCFGCRENYQANFMHDCTLLSREQKFEQYFDRALFLLNWNDLAKDILQKNLNIDYDYVLYQQEFFDAIDADGLFKSIKKMYITVDSNDDDDDLIIC